MANPRTTQRLRRLALLLVLAGAVGGWAWYTKPWAEKPIEISVETVAAGPATEILAVNGQLVPGNEVVLGAAVAGQISEVLVKEGDQVTEGQILARIEDTIAQAAVEQAEATLESARIDAESAQAAYDRALALKQSMSVSARDSARFTAEAAAAKVRQLAAAAQQARRQLALYHITSPIAGTVLSMNTELGQIVGAASTLFRIGDLAAPLVETDVDEVYGARMKPGLDARVATVGSREVAAATVSFVAPSVDPDTGGRTVRLAFDTPLEVPLPAGLTMSVNIVVETFDAAITLPRTAIRDLGGNPFVMLEKDGRAASVPVSVRSWPSDRLIVAGGLKPGDRVITEPQDIAEGALVAEAANGGG